jgi:hypothetical protein
VNAGGDKIVDGRALVMLAVELVEQAISTRARAS